MMYISAWASKVQCCCLPFLFFVFIAGQVDASSFLVPGGIHFSVPETCDLQQAKFHRLHEVEGKDALEGHHHIQPSHNYRGLGRMIVQGGEGEPLENGSHGNLELFLVHSDDYEFQSMQTIGVKGLNTKSASQSYKSVNENCSENDCYSIINHSEQPIVGQEDALSEKYVFQVSLHPLAPMHQAVFDNVTYDRLLLAKPIVMFDGHECPMGAPTGRSYCRDLKAVVMHFTPTDKALKTELVVHTLDSGHVARGESVLSELELLSANKQVLSRVLQRMTPYTPGNNFTSYHRLPVTGRAIEEQLAEQRVMSQEEQKIWNRGTCSGTIYCGDLDFYNKQAEAFKMHSYANAMQVDMTPSATKFQAEIVAMIKELQGGEDIGVWKDGVKIDAPSGYITGGGTFSNIAAMDAFISAARKKGVRRPVVLVADTVHPSILKACKKLNIEVEIVRTPQSSKRLPVDGLRHKILEMTDNDIGQEASRSFHDKPKKHVIAIVASAPNYSYGITDPIREISDLVVSLRNEGREIYFHVDSCMGGLIYPFAYSLSDRVNQVGCDDYRNRSGIEVECPTMTFPEPLFKYEGVSSVSADVHKYGYSVKGVSVILFRSKDLLRAQFYTQADWDGGAMISYGMAGSSSGGLLAAAHLAMTSNGQVGYMEKAAKILVTAFRMQNIVRSYPDDLEIIGEPGMCFAFRAKDPEKFNIFHIADFMGSTDPKWRFNHLQNPNALHFCVTVPQTWQKELATASDVSLIDGDAINEWIKEQFHQHGQEVAVEDSLVKQAELIDQDLSDFLSDAVVRFEQHLTEAVSYARDKGAVLAASGSMYGLGAAGINIHNPVLRKALLEGGALALLDDPSTSIPMAVSATMYWAEKISMEELGWDDGQY